MNTPTHGEESTINEFASAETIVMRAKASKLGPTFIASLTPDQQKDRFIQKLLKRNMEMPAHSKPWTVEYQVSALIGALALSQVRELPLAEVSQFNEAAVALLEKEWSPHMIADAVECIKTNQEKCPDLSRPVLIQRAIDFAQRA